MITLPLFLLVSAAGILSGLFGIGGGIVLVPGLIYFLKFEPIEASCVSLGIFLGALVGVKRALLMPVKLLQKLFSLLLIFSAYRIWNTKI